MVTSKVAVATPEREKPNGKEKEKRTMVAQWMGERANQFNQFVNRFDCCPPVFYLAHLLFSPTSPSPPPSPHPANQYPPLPCHITAKCLSRSLTLHVIIIMDNLSIIMFSLFLLSALPQNHQ